MEKRNSALSKSKSNQKASAKLSSGKKRKNKSGKAKSCLLFFSNVAKKFGHKKNATSWNIAHYILNEITKTLPLRTSSNSTKSIPNKKSQAVIPDKLPIQIVSTENNVTAYAEDIDKGPILDTMNITEHTQLNADPQTSKWVPPKPKVAKAQNSKPITLKEDPFTVPRMPLVNSDVFKMQEEMRFLHKINVKMEDAASNTNRERDTAEEIAKHVDTLRKISIIADEFNKKTAKNLKEVINSVQLDLLKKLDEASAQEFGHPTPSQTNPVLSINQ